MTTPRSGHPRPRPRRAPTLATMAVIAIAAAGCQTRIVTAEASGSGEAMLVTPLPAALVTDLGIDGIGDGAVSWWAYEDDLAPPATGLTAIGPFQPVRDVMSIEILHPMATAAPGHPDRQRDQRAPAVPEVVVRPAWSTRVDNQSDSATTTEVDDEVTVSFATPGSPGQHPNDVTNARVHVVADLDVAAGDCVDVTSLQAWQLDAPEVDAAPGQAQAEFLGSVLVEMPCA